MRIFAIPKRPRMNKMKEILYAVSVLGMATLMSCSEQYLVSGTSNVDGLDGKTLRLKVFSDGDMRTIDSSRVVHGKFTFKGVIDSVVMANVFVGDQSVMPVVLENGEVKMKIETNMQTATGTPLNDSLSSFIQKKSVIDAQMAELPHMESRMIMDGVDHDEILEVLGRQAMELEEQNDVLVTSFIRTNYNNVLGPGIFMILTSAYSYPILNPQIEDIISQAPPYFLSNQYVKEYIKAAESNMKKLREKDL